MHKSIKIDSNKEVLLSIGEAADYLGVSIDTLRRWEKKDKIIALRSPGGHRYFRQKDLDSLFGRKYEREKEKEPRKTERKVEDESTVKTGDTVIERPTTHELPDRRPREVNIPPLSPVKIIKEDTPAFQTHSEYLPQHISSPAQPRESVLTPPIINNQNQAKPINSVPPAIPIEQKTVRKKSNAWIYLVLGLTLLIIGFTMFIIFRSPTEVISPVP